MPHHLLGTVSPDMEFTAKDFRDSTIPVSTNFLLFFFFLRSFIFLFLCSHGESDNDMGGFCRDKLRIFGSYHNFIRNEEDKLASVIFSITFDRRGFYFYQSTSGSPVPYHHIFAIPQLFFNFVLLLGHMNIMFFLYVRITSCILNDFCPHYFK